MKTAIWIVLTLVCIPIIFNCGKKEEKYYTVEKVDGVEFVHNHKPLWGDEKKIELKLHLTIGGIDVTDEGYIFNRIRGANIDEYGNYYIIDSGDHCIKKYDAQGNYLSTIGRRGQGPGEFSQPTCLSFDKSGHLIVYEIRSRRVQRIPIEPDPKNSIIINYDIKYIHEIKTLNSGLLVISTNSFNTFIADDSSSHRVLITDNDFNIVDSFLGFKSFNKCYGNVKDIGFSLWNRIRIGVDSEDNLFIAEEYENKFEKYSVEGRLLRRFDRDLQYEIKTYVGKEYTSLWFTHSTLGLEIDHKNRVWIQSYSEAHSDDEIERYFRGVSRNDMKLRPLNRRFEVYDNEGHLLCNMDPFKDKEMIMLNIVDDKMLLRDEDRITLYVYKIVEK